MFKKIISVTLLLLTVLMPATLADTELKATELNSNYNQVISKYIDALSNNWSEDSLVNNHMFKYTNTNGFTTADSGYFTRDVDGNGVEELFIIHQSPNYKDGANYIIDSYTLVGGNLKQLYCPESQSDVFQILPDGHFLYRIEMVDDLIHLNSDRYEIDESRDYGGFEGQFSPTPVSYFPFNMLNVPAGDGIPIYRTYNMQNGEHLYSSDLAECAQLMSKGWTSEGVCWIASGNGTPVYRLASPDGGQHLYTTDENEVSDLISSHGWTTDNGGQPLFYSGGEIPIYRLYDSKTGQHILTRDAGEYNSLPSQGWIQEGSPISALS